MDKGLKKSSNSLNMKEQLSTEHRLSKFQNKLWISYINTSLGSEELSYSSTFQKHYFHTHSQHVYV